HTEHTEKPACSSPCVPRAPCVPWFVRPAPAAARALTKRRPSALMAAFPGGLLRETVLHDVHAAMGAKMVEFGGWHMPVSYSGIREEHRAVRTAAGLFDLSHMGRVHVSGPAKVEYLEAVQTQKVGDAEMGEARYALLCDERG